MLGKVKLGGGLEAIHAATQVDLVSVEGEDLLFGEAPFNLNGEVGFLKLANPEAVSGEEEVTGQLHGERGSALGAAVGAEVVPQSTTDAQYVDAPMGLEALVFNGEDGLTEDGSEVVVTDHHAAFQREGANDRSEERRVGKECRSRWSP